MTTTACAKCNDTGYYSRRFYTQARTCTCPVGIFRASWDCLTPDERNARAAAEAEANAIAARAARIARRAARDAH